MIDYMITKVDIEMLPEDDLANLFIEADRAMINPTTELIHIWWWCIEEINHRMDLEEGLCRCQG